MSEQSALDAAVRKGQSELLECGCRVVFSDDRRRAQLEFCSALHSRAFWLSWEWPIQNASAIVDEAQGVVH